MTIVREREGEVPNLSCPLTQSISRARYAPDYSSRPDGDPWSASYPATAKLDLPTRRHPDYISHSPS